MTKYSSIPQAPIRELQEIAGLIRPIGRAHPNLRVDIQNQIVQGVPRYMIVVALGKISSLKHETPAILGNEAVGYNEIMKRIRTNLAQDLEAFEAAVAA